MQRVITFNFSKLKTLYRGNETNTCVTWSYRRNGGSRVSARIIDDDTTSWDLVLFTHVHKRRMNNNVDAINSFPSPYIYGAHARSPCSSDKYRNKYSLTLTVYISTYLPGLEPGQRTSTLPLGNCQRHVRTNEVSFLLG